MTERKIDFMKTDLFHIGKFVIHGYGLMIGIGFVLALLVGEYRAKKMGMKEEALIDIAIIAGVSGFLGAKLLYIIVSFKDFIEDGLRTVFFYLHFLYLSAYLFEIAILRLSTLSSNS